MESRTNKMVLFWTGEHEVHKTKWSHLCQQRQLSLALMVWFKKKTISHARHVWQGDTPKLPAHVTRTGTSAERDHPQIVSGEIPHLPSGAPRDLSRDPNGWSPPLSRFN